MSKRKRVPELEDEARERAFWEVHDSADYVDWSAAERVRLPNLKPSTRSISLRLPEHLLDDIKTLANAMDVPYQSLIKTWLQEDVQRHADGGEPGTNHGAPARRSR